MSAIQGRGEKDDNWVGTPQAVQCSSLHYLVEGVWGQSLVRELSTHVHHGQNKHPTPGKSKTICENRSNTVANSIKTVGFP